MYDKYLQFLRSSLLVHPWRHNLHRRLWALIRTSTSTTTRTGGYGYEYEYEYEHEYEPESEFLVFKRQVMRTRNSK